MLFKRIASSSALNPLLGPALFVADIGTSAAFNHRYYQKLFHLSDAALYLLPVIDYLFSQALSTPSPAPSRDRVLEKDIQFRQFLQGQVPAGTPNWLSTFFLGLSKEEKTYLSKIGRAHV